MPGPPATAPDPRAARLAARLDAVLAADGLVLAPGARALLAATWADGAWETVPTWAVAALARAAGAPDPDTLGLCMAASYAAAHLADDLADQDADPAAWARGTLDMVRLLAVARACLRHLGGVDGPTRQALGAELDRLQLALCDGQQADLDDRERLDQPPWALAEAKAGAGLGGYLAMAALALGAPPADGATVARWRAAGAHFGALGQACSDVFDLMLGPTSEDWEQGLPSFLLRLGLDQAVGPALRVGLAGPRAATLGPLREELAADAGLWTALLGALGARRAALDRACGDDPRLAPVQERARALVDQVAGLRAQVRPRPRVWLPSWGQRAARAAAFLGADPALDEAVVHHRWGFAGRPLVSADVFQRLVILDMLGPWQSAADSGGPEGLGGPAGLGAVHGTLPALVARARDWGWRYFGALPVLPPDIDTTGLALRVLAGPAGGRCPGAEDVVKAAAETILDDPCDTGLLHTWRPHPRCAGTLPWDPRPCPVATSNALAGLDAAARAGVAGAWGPRADRALAAVAAWATDGGGATSLYPAGVAQGWVLWGLVRLGERAPARVGPAVRALAARVGARFDRRGRAGTVLDTAFCLGGLRAAQAVDMVGLRCAAAALGTAMEPDGGYPADPFFPSISPGLGPAPGPLPRLVGSRRLTTAVVLRALAGCGRLAPPQRGPLPTAAVPR